MIVSCRASVVFHISDVDECLMFPCLHDGVCNNLDGSYNCSCQEGWSGDNCQTGNQIFFIHETCSFSEIVDLSS